MRAYLLSATKTSLYLAFGEDCVSAAVLLGQKLGVDPKEFSVGGSWAIDPNQPINLGKLWPYYTAFPPERYCHDSGIDGSAGIGGILRPNPPEPGLPENVS